MDPKTLVALITAIAALVAALPPLLAEFRRWRRPPGAN
jgi:hypothetical protein